MKVAVWDTYVKSKNGVTLHFDIIVPDEVKDAKTIYTYGKKHLTSIGEPAADLSTEQCQFCHIETPTKDMIKAINEQGYYILEMEDIPTDLPENPTRRDMILHLRAHYMEHRFANFRGVDNKALQRMVESAND